MPVNEAFAVSYDNMKDLLQKELERLRAEIGNLEREHGRLQLEVDKRREEVEKLDKALEAHQAELGRLSDKVASGRTKLDEHHANITRSLEQTEAKANARIEVAEQREAAAGKAEAKATQQYGRVKAAKADLLAEMAQSLQDLTALSQSLTKKLADIS